MEERRKFGAAAHHDFLLAAAFEQECQEGGQMFAQHFENCVQKRAAEEELAMKSPGPPTQVRRIGDNAFLLYSRGTPCLRRVMRGCMRCKCIDTRMRAAARASTRNSQAPMWYRCQYYSRWGRYKRIND